MILQSLATLVALFFGLSLTCAAFVVLLASVKLLLNALLLIFKDVGRSFVAYVKAIFGERIHD